MVLLGEIDSARPNNLTEVSAEEILIMQGEMQEKRDEQERIRNRILMDRGEVARSAKSGCMRRQS